MGINFISHSSNNNPKTIKDLRKESDRIAYKTKEIAYISDLGRLFSPNFNPDF